MPRPFPAGRNKRLRPLSPQAYNNNNNDDDSTNLELVGSGVADGREEAALEACDVALAVAAHLEPLLEAVQTEVTAELAHVRAEPDTVLAHDHLRQVRLTEYAR